MENSLVLKIGGSIFNHPQILDDFIYSFCANLHPEWRYFVLMGGGNKCNQLRQQYKSNANSEEKDSKFHWKSIEIMGDNAEFLHSKLISQNIISPVHLIKDISSTNINNPGIYIIQPFKDLYKSDPLEHSWRVTSDSIALYYANRLHSQICVLVKNKPYFIIDKIEIHSISSSKLLEHPSFISQNENLGKGLVDPFGPYLCREYKIPILILDGTDQSKVSNFLSKYPEHTDSTNSSSFGIEITPQ
ncbi:MAG: hypothetical protein ACTSRE_05690 [Promethearchaeota archaeon]